MGLTEDRDEEPKQRKRSEWSKYSKCSGIDIEKVSPIFFPEQRGRPRKIPPHEGICSVCPVMNECLNYALVHNEKGVWGNSTESQRNRLKKYYPQFVKNLKEQARREGWLEHHPDPEQVLAPVLQLPIRQEAAPSIEDWLDAL